MIVIVTIALVLLGGLAFVVSYNRFVRQRNLVQESWRQVDVELHRRHDLIPNLVEAVRTYANHERQVFEDVSRLRNAAVSGGSDLTSRAEHESQLSGALRQLFAVSEAYPQLRSDAAFVSLQRQLAETEDRIAAGRRFYNANVRAYNTRVESVPSNLIAGMFDFVKAEYFEVEDAEVRATPTVDFGNVGTPAPPAATPPQVSAGRPVDTASGQIRPDAAYAEPATRADRAPVQQPPLQPPTP